MENSLTYTGYLPFFLKYLIVLVLRRGKIVEEEEIWGAVFLKHCSSVTSIVLASDD